MSITKQGGGAVAKGNGIAAGVEGGDVVSHGYQGPAPEIHRGHVFHYVEAKMLTDVVGESHVPEAKIDVIGNGNPHELHQARMAGSGEFVGCDCC